MSVEQDTVEATKLAGVLIDITKKWVNSEVANPAVLFEAYEIALSSILEAIQFNNPESNTHYKVEVSIMVQSSSQDRED